MNAGMNASGRVKSAGLAGTRWGGFIIDVVENAREISKADKLAAASYAECAVGELNLPKRLMRFPEYELAPDDWRLRKYAADFTYAVNNTADMNEAADALISIHARARRLLKKRPQAQKQGGWHISP